MIGSGYGISSWVFGVMRRSGRGEERAYVGGGSPATAALPPLLSMGAVRLGRRRVSCCGWFPVHHLYSYTALIKYFPLTLWLRASGCSGSFVLYNQRQLFGVDVVNVAVDVDILWRTFRFSHQAGVVLQ